MRLRGSGLLRKRRRRDRRKQRKMIRMTQTEFRRRYQLGGLNG